MTTDILDLLRGVVRRWDGVLEAAGPALGLAREDCRALDIVLQYDGLATGELARRLYAPPRHGGAVVDRLMLAGLVERVHDVGDARIIRVRATAAGRRQHERAWEGAARQLDQRLAGYASYELGIVRRFLADAREALDAAAAGRD